MSARDRIQTATIIGLAVCGALLFLLMQAAQIAHVQF
jgi:hypothetical protein